MFAAAQAAADDYLHSVQASLADTNATAANTLSQARSEAKRILELNVDHPAFMALETARVLDPERAKKYVEILYNQALLIAGLPIENPSAYTDLLCSLWK